MSGFENQMGRSNQETAPVVTFPDNWKYPIKVLDKEIAIVQTLLTSTQKVLMRPTIPLAKLEDRNDHIVFGKANLMYYIQPANIPLTDSIRKHRIINELVTLAKIAPEDYDNFNIVIRKTIYNHDILIEAQDSIHHDEEFVVLHEPHVDNSLYTAFVELESDDSCWTQVLIRDQWVNIPYDNTHLIILPGIQSLQIPVQHRVIAKSDVEFSRSGLVVQVRRRQKV